MDILNISNANFDLTTRRSRILISYFYIEFYISIFVLDFCVALYITLDFDNNRKFMSDK